NDSSQCQLSELKININNSSDSENIKGYLDLLLLALEAIANISSEAIIQVAKDLKLASVVGDYLRIWQSKSSDSQKISDGDGKELNVEEVKGLITIICHLANQNQELIRRAVCLLEQAIEQKQLPRPTLLDNYLQQFTHYYQQRISDSPDISAASLSDLAWKLLINLLFYSGNNGQGLLWSAVASGEQMFNKAYQI
ncbi:MAG: DUF3038 domain-containing protein, partial [Cyanobacteria bacterium P01_G01_bin.39]